MLEGSTEDLSLTMNTGKARDYNTGQWLYTQAYGSERQGSDETGYYVLRGTEMTEDMRRTEPLTKSYSFSDEDSVSLQNESVADNQGFYYYFPRLVNENSTYTSSNSKPQCAADLPPVLVIYKPAYDKVSVRTGASASTSNLCLDQCAASETTAAP